METVFVDTGALVALLDRSDEWHDWAVGVFKKLRPPLLTCEAVLAEAWHLLGESGPSRRALAKLHKSGVLRVVLDFEQSAPGIWRLLEKYADTPMDLADACVVSLSEGDPKSRVWTTDSDFLVYRRHGRQAIPLIAPFFEEQGFGILACSPSGNLHLRQPLCRIAEAIQPHVELVHER